MDTQFIHTTSLDIAEICKPLENAIRYCEIALAEELSVLCEKKQLNFEEVRQAVNSKWNINLKEARDGIGRHCLPKDIQIMDKLFPANTFFKSAMNADSKYRGHLENKGIETAAITVDGWRTIHRVK
jgi:UDP-N-acetyl-D-mannosaminuronic acid dehydrogenase